MKFKKLFAAVLAASCLTAATVPASAAWIADLDQDNWAYPYAAALVEEGIMETDAYGYFYPDVPTSRGEFVTALWKAFGSQPVDAEISSFEGDIPSWSEYFVPVEWAYVTGITTGISETHFGPDLDLTREQAFTFLFRAMVYLDVAPTYGPDHEFYKQISEFNDYELISPWAADPIQLLMDVGIVTGSDTNEVWPKQSVNNAATAAILSRALIYIADAANG